MAITEVLIRLRSLVRAQNGPPFPAKGKTFEKTLQHLVERRRQKLKDSKNQRSSDSEASLTAQV